MADKIREMNKRRITTKESKKNFSFKDLSHFVPRIEGNDF